MSKKLSSLKIDECKPGDVCWIVLKSYSRPLYGTIEKLYLAENGIRVITLSDGYRTVLCDHAFWEESDAKEFKKANKNL